MGFSMTRPFDVTLDQVRYSVYLGSSITKDILSKTNIINLIVYIKRAFQGKCNLLIINIVSACVYKEEILKDLCM